MVSSQVIRIPERGETTITADQWYVLANDDAFWRLVEGGVVAVGQRTHATAVLRGSCYVGRASTAAGTIQVVEKIDGALASLLAYATHDAFRVDPLTSPATDLGDLAVLLVRQFQQAVMRYVSRGRDRRFVRKPQAASLVGGRIDITKTIALRARGLGHLIAFERDELTRHVLKNRVLLAALREIERLAAVLGLTPDDIARGRSLTQFFNDCRDAEVLFGRRDVMAAHARRLSASDRERDADMLSLAAVLLSHESFENEDPSGPTAPRAWFLNLETLFEHAVRATFQEICPDAQVIKGAAAGVGVFPAAPDIHPADPDVVVYHGADTVVGDVKYKDWTKSAGSRSDLYQLLVHAAAFGSTRSFLLYPHDRLEVVRLGEAVTGSTATLLAIDVRDVRAGVVWAAEELGLPVEESSTGLAAA